VLIARESEYLIPSGGTVLQAGDILFTLSDAPSYQRVAAELAALA